MIVMAKMCEATHTVDDATFGYWHEGWGDSPIHEFPCGEPADIILDIEGPDGTDEVALCAHHAKAELS